MAMRGVKYVDCYGVDNALVITDILSIFYFLFLSVFSSPFLIMISPGQVRVADPTFLGYFIDKGVATAAKVVRKVRRCFLLFYAISFSPSFLESLNLFSQIQI
jgi:UDP-N-acetylglucosamine/UDP-N-acetylgalactosamine diphosphorylase